VNDATQVATPVGRHGDRVKSSHSSTNGQINAAETGSPDSVDNKDQQSPPVDGNGQDLE